MAKYIMSATYLNNHIAGKTIKRIDFMEYADGNTNIRIEFDDGASADITVTEIDRWLFYPAEVGA